MAGARKLFPGWAEDLLREVTVAALQSVSLSRRSSSRRCSCGSLHQSRAHTNTERDELHGIPAMDLLMLVVQAVSLHHHEGDQVEGHHLMVLQ